MSDNKNMKEKISALADGELSDFETRRILDEISSNPQYRDFWSSIQQTKLSLEESDAEFLDSDISEQLYSKLGKRRPIKKEQLNKPSLSKFQFYAASFAGCLGVIIYSLIPQSSETFSDFASQKINQAIDSPQAMEVLNNSVSDKFCELGDLRRLLIVFESTEFSIENVFFIACTLGSLSCCSCIISPNMVVVSINLLLDSPSCILLAPKASPSPI